VASRPRIGVTGPDHGGTVAWWFTALAIFRAGGWPVRIRPGRPRTVDDLHGLVLGGGADVGDITERVFDRMSPAKFALLGRVLDHVVMSANGRAAMTSVTLADLADCGAKSEDTDGLINFLRNVDGVDVALFCRETEDGSTKVSFRAH